MAGGGRSPALVKILVPMREASEEPVTPVSHAAQSTWPHCSIEASKALGKLRSRNLTTREGVHALTACSEVVVEQSMVCVEAMPAVSAVDRDCGDVRG